MSARHRKVQATRRYLYRVGEHAHDLRLALRDAGVPDAGPLACVTEDEVDRLRRLADKADALAREVDALQAAMFERLLAYEAPQGARSEET